MAGVAPDNRRSRRAPHHRKVTPTFSAPCPCWLRNSDDDSSSGGGGAASAVVGEERRLGGVRWGGVEGGGLGVKAVGGRGIYVRK